MSEGKHIGLECDMESSQEELLMDSLASAQTKTRRRAWFVVVGLVSMCAAVSFWRKTNVIEKVDSDLFLGLAEQIEATKEAGCGDLPFVLLTGVVSSNLGKQGPDHDAEEGIIYSATQTNTGTHIENLQIHVHSLNSFDVEGDDDENYDKDYRPAFTHGPFVNGIHGKFACINVKQGTTLKMRAHAYDADKQEDVDLPRAYVSFFDLDTGIQNNHSVEHVKIAGYSAYYLSNETEIKTVHDESFYATKDTDGGTGDVIKLGGGFTGFYATLEGTGDDNPSDPLLLTKQQKDRAVTIEFADVTKFDFEIGASPGKTARVFSFVFRPSLLCAKTTVHKHLFPARGDRAPLVPVEVDVKKSDACNRLPSVILIFGVLSIFVQSFA